MGTRQNFVSAQYYKPVIVERVGATVAVNSQLMVHVALYEVFTDSVPDDTIPEGRNLLAGAGGDGYLTDDGQSGLLEAVLEIQLQEGARLCWSVNNTDVFIQPVFMRAGLRLAESQ